MFVCRRFENLLNVPSVAIKEYVLSSRVRRWIVLYGGCSGKVCGRCRDQIGRVGAVRDAEPKSIDSGSLGYITARSFPDPNPDPDAEPKSLFWLTTPDCG